MIHSLTSSLASFKPVELRPGLNLLVATKTRTSTEKQTRNGAGKSSFVELVHFMLGARWGESNAFLKKTAALAEARFQLTMDLGGQLIEVQRSPLGAPQGKIELIRGDPSAWKVPVKSNKKRGELTLDQGAWKTQLGHAMFGLSTEAAGDDDEAALEPTFRMLFPYFARRDREGGFFKPEQHATKQQLGDQQIALTYLLGLDVAIPGELEGIRRREAMLRSLAALRKAGGMGGALPQASELFTRLSVAEARAAALERELAGFRVIERYVELEAEANLHTRHIATLKDDNEGDLALLETLKEALLDERPPRYADVERAYREAEVVLPALVRKRFEEVEKFHASVVRNRSSYLEQEIADANARVQARRAQMTSADRRRSEILATLSSGGALETYTKFRGELMRVNAEVARLRELHRDIKKIEGDKTTLDLERKQLLVRLQNDHEEQADTLKLAIQTFERISSALYQNQDSGSLEISAKENGPEFRVVIPASRSSGKNHMQIFSFDMMLMELMARRERGPKGPGFLIHDSAVFDGVDGRQVGRALDLGRKLSEEHGFQYIVTMNQDTLEQAQHEARVDLGAHVLPVRLTDETETGGLFGFRFD